MKKDQYEVLEQVKGSRMKIRVYGPDSIEKCRQYVKEAVWQGTALKDLSIEYVREVKRIRWLF